MILKKIDDLLNRVTMYRLAVYELVFLLVVAGILGQFGVMPYSPINIAFSAVFIFVVCWITNTIFSYFFESVNSFNIPCSLNFVRLFTAEL